MMYCMLVASASYGRVRAHEAPRPPSRRRKTLDTGALLLVEDSDGDAFLVEELLLDEARDVDICRATRVAEALSMLPGKFALVLLDLGLPDGNGLDVLERIRTVAGTTPIVVLTGRDDEHLARMCLESGAQD